MLFKINEILVITFGGLLAEATAKNMAAMESLVSGFVCGMTYGFFSGQPLTILGSTGPVLVFETIVFEFCALVEWGEFLKFKISKKRFFIPIRGLIIFVLTLV